MAINPARPDPPEASLFADGLGERTVTVDTGTGDLLQVLHLRPALTAVPSFEFALRERAARLANFRHASYARVRRIDRVQSPSAGLAVVSDHIEGTRLSELLRVAHEQRLPLDTNAALYLIQQLVPAVTLLHENARDAAHGLIAPERIVVTAQGRLVLVEHVLGAAIEQLQCGRDRLWQDFRIAMPATAGLPRFDHRADIAGIGIVALALMLGRPLERDEYPHQVVNLLNQAPARVGGSLQPLSPGLRGWIARALQLEIRRAFATVSEAASALDEVLAAEPDYVAAPVALETFLSRYGAALLAPLPAAPPAAPEPPLFTAGPPPHAEPPARTPEAAWLPPMAPAGIAPPAIAPPSAPESSGQMDHALPDLAELIDLTDLNDLSSPPRPAPGPAFEPLTPQAPAPATADAATGAPTADGPLQPTPEPFGAEPKPLFDPDAPFSIPLPEPAPARQARRIPWRKVAVAAALLVAVVTAGVASLGYFSTTDAPALGTLVVESNPPGVPVFVDGVDRGLTPARITLAPGSHILELRRGVPRVIPFTLSAGAEVTQYLEFAETPAFGRLVVQSEPAGARVIVNGADRGIAPLALDDLTPGEHEITLQTDVATSRHRVVVQAGGNASLVVPIAAAVAGPVSGWVSIKAPFRIEIYEDGRLLGNNEAERLMLPAGRHELELVNETLNYRVTRVVQVPPGRTAPLTLELPRGVVNLNATPWAEVWIDGQRVGETPIGNLSVPIGAREIVFKHPQFGEKRHAVSVTLGAPLRVSVDMRQD